ncbi:MAG: translation initiation factor Sui1 [Betaproteobacteria bacterium]
MATSNRTTGRLVYSTGLGRMCPVCRKPVEQCICSRGKLAAPPADGIVRVSRESKGRGGKTVTVIKGLDLDVAALTDLGKRLKAACGTGGTVKDGAIELQGDHCDRVIEDLKARGHPVRRAGG